MSSKHLDAEWKRIQKKVFTRWANEQLKSTNKSIADLQTDLGDGLCLIALAEILSGKEFKRYNGRPRVRNQKMENVEMFISFLTKDENIRLVNIGKFTCTQLNVFILKLHNL
ncbi:hypothetical protein FSP39_016722 [Pinctada imbricata]|uniref:Calponin-homology (CH) domain-containing protein n=1 Tax=Pinctada imbricata TaxID=66713 RepID=A0AA89BLZ9_PINIB|nr:hypothetical protein FSP39_007485 [Pinctada imbricata]KAK3103132.1 hypothetical protein FSP39_016722 [Pinctada imbricata]